jgi:hypothetical protein
LIRPLGEYAVAQFANLLDRSGLGFMGRAALGYQLLDQIRNFQEALSHMRLVREAFVQAGTWFRHSRR